MDNNLLLSAIIFGLVTSVTPGPNNAYLLISGMNFGLRQSMPYLLGILIGLTVIVLSVIFGLGLVFAQYPASYQILKWIGFAYICWMAFGIATSGTSAAEAKSKGRLGLWRSIGFQFVNPKAWIIAASYVTMYVPRDQGFQNALIFGFVLVLTTFPGAFVWLTAGNILRNWLSNPDKRRIFNYFASGILVLSMLPVLFI